MKPRDRKRLGWHATMGVCDVTIFNWYDQPKTTLNFIAMKWNEIIDIYDICKYDMVIKPHNVWDSISWHTTESLMQNYSHGHWIHTKDFLSLCDSQFNSSSPGQNGRHFVDGIFKRIFLNEKVQFLTKCHWSLFLKVQLTIPQQATSHYLEQCWPEAVFMAVNVCMTGIIVPPIYIYPYKGLFHWHIYICMHWRIYATLGGRMSYISMYLYTRL